MKKKVLLHQDNRTSSPDLSCKQLLYQFDLVACYFLVSLNIPLEEYRIFFSKKIDNFKFIFKGKNYEQLVDAEKVPFTKRKARHLNSLSKSIIALIIVVIMMAIIIKSHCNTDRIILMMSLMLDEGKGSDRMGWIGLDRCYMERTG